MVIIPEIKKISENAEDINAQSHRYARTNAGSFMEGKLSDYSKLALIEPAGCDDKLYFAVLSSEPSIMLEENISFNFDKKHSDGYYIKAGSKEGLNYTLILSETPRGVIYGFDAYEKLCENSENNHFIGEVTDYPDTDFRAFHMDMRYGFPKFERLLEIVDELVEWRFNTFLIEYENRFPFEKNSDISDPEHYSAEQIAAFLNYAEERHIAVIPLQQTIGHLEYLLKHPKYHHLREVRAFPKTDEAFSLNTVGFKFFNEIDEICASNEAAYEIVEGMLTDIITAHPNSKYIHIGCDEAWNLITCEDCIARYGKDGKNQLYLNHINRMAKIVLDSGKIPIVWDDMLRSFSDEELSALDSRIVIMIWLYYKSNHKLAVDLSKRFKSFGFNVLGAAAAKCAEGPEPQFLDMPWYSLRLGNVEMWSDVCKSEGLDGFCMTVWSNYSGTIAPPHPFFDTIWYPVLFAAEKMWNLDAATDDFGEKFISGFFGVEDIDIFSGRTEHRYENTIALCEKAVSHKYEAEVLKVMQLLSIYRMKSLAIARELYKIDSGDEILAQTTEVEKTIVRNRAEDVLNMKNILKPLVHKVVSTHYSEKDAEIFVRSRFDADEKLYGIYSKKG